jgi:hypothetical protein
VLASCYARYKGLVVLGPQPISAIIYLINSSTAPGLIKAWTYGLSGIALEILLVRPSLLSLPKVTDDAQIYRVFIVWERAWAMVALPALLTLFNFAGFIMVVHVEATSGILGDGSPRVRTWSSVVFGLDALTNVICSGMSSTIDAELHADRYLVLLIWRIVRNSNGSMSSGGRGSLMVRPSTPPSRQLSTLNSPTARPDHNRRVRRHLHVCQPPPSIPLPDAHPAPSPFSWSAGWWPSRHGSPSSSTSSRPLLCAHPPLSFFRSLTDAQNIGHHVVSTHSACGA